MQTGRLQTADFLLPAGVVLMFVTSLGMFFPDTTTVLFDALTKQPNQVKDVTNFFAFAAVAFGACLAAVCLAHALPAANGTRHLLRTPVWLAILVAGSLFLVGQAACYRNFFIVAQSSTVPRADEWNSVTASAQVWKHIGVGLLALAGLLGCSTRIRTTVTLVSPVVSGRFWAWGATFFAAASASWQFLSGWQLNKAIQLMTGSAASPKPTALAELARDIMTSGVAAACTLIGCGFCGSMAVRAYQRSTAVNQSGD